MPNPTLSIDKIVATGNDFLFVDARTALPGEFAKQSRRTLATFLCDRHYGIGADGLVFVENASVPGRLKWDFYNNDGSHAEMCGNASRCMGRWASRHLQAAKIEFETDPGIVRAEVSGEEITSHLDYLNVVFTDIKYEVAGKVREAVLVNTGVPHAVVVVEDIAKAVEASADIEALRFHDESGPRGCNVTFVQLIAKAPLSLATVTFERGIEDFTLSCGTGVLAASAVVLRELELAPNTPVDVSAPGGDLQVIFGSQWRGASLQGMAEHIMIGQVDDRLAK